ncbi:MAG: histidine phosphatase family protein [Eubacteriales bacterium]
MIHIFFLRHGQSMGNLERRFLGHTDLPLTDLGCRQADRAAAYLAEQGITAVYSSDLLRACQTAAPIAEKYGLTVDKCAGLREIYAGKWEGLPFTVLADEYADSYHTFRRDLGRACPDGGESTQEVGDRVYRTILDICRRHEMAGDTDATLLLSSHATAICMFACRVLGLAPAECKRLYLPANASVSLFDYEDGRFYLRQYANDGYLGELRFLPPPLA